MEIDSETLSLSLIMLEITIVASSKNRSQSNMLELRHIQIQIPHNSSKLASTRIRSVQKSEHMTS